MSIGKEAPPASLPNLKSHKTIESTTKLPSVTAPTSTIHRYNRLQFEIIPFLLNAVSNPLDSTSAPCPKIFIGAVHQGPMVTIASESGSREFFILLVHQIINKTPNDFKAIRGPGRGSITSCGYCKVGPFPREKPIRLQIDMHGNQMAKSSQGHPIYFQNTCRLATPEREFRQRQPKS